MAQTLFGTDTTPSLVDLDVNFTELYSKTAWATTGVGYAAGAGGTIIQATSKSTGVTLNKTTGQITMNAASLAASTSVSFTLTNSFIALADDPRVTIASGATAGAYLAVVDAVAAGSCRINLRNLTAGALAESVVLNFNLFKGSAT